MSISTAKKILLAGTALVAVSAFGAQAQAANVPQTLTGATTWASTGLHTNATTDGTTAVAGDDVNTATFLLTVTNNGTANDGSANLNTFALGAVTGTTGGLKTDVGSANDLAVTIGSVALSGAAPVTITNATTPTQANTTSVTGALSTGGALAVTNAGGATKAVTLTVGGNTTVTGTTTVTAGTAAGATSTLTVNGATNVFTGAVTLNDGTGSTAQLVLGSGATSDTFTGGLIGSAAGHGTLTLQGANAITGNVGATSLALINDTASTGTASISGTTGATTVTNAGAGTLTLSGAVTATNLNENGAGGTINLNAGGANTIGTANFGADGTIALGTAAGTISGNVTTTTTNTGTLQLNAAAGTQTIGGTVGSSTLLLKEVDGGATGNVSSTFTGAVDATLLKVLGTGTVTLNAAGANLIGTTNFAGDGTVSLATGGTLTGNVTTATTNTGTLTLAGTETVTGTVGTSSKLLKEIKAGAGNASITQSANATTLLFNGANTVDLEGAANNIGTVDFNSTLGTLKLDAGASLTGNIDNTGATGGALTLVSGTQTVTGTVGATHAIGAITAATNLADVDTFTSTVNAASITGGAGSLVFQGAVNTSGNVVAANTTTVGANLITAGGTFTLGSGQTLNVSSAGGAQTSGVLATGAANVNVASKIDLTTTAAPTAVGLTKTYVLVAGTAGTIGNLNAGNLVVNGVADTAAGTTAFRSGAEQYVETIVGDDLEVVATREATTTTATSNETSVAAALNTIGAGTGTLATAITNYTSASTAQANQILASLAPSVTGGAQSVAFDVGNETQDVANVRMAGLRDGDDKSGVAAGASANGVSLWLEGYGQHANQDAMDSVAGYSANTWGGVVGVDSTNLLDRTVLGVAFNYGHSKVDSNDATNTHTGLDNYGVDLYGTYDLGNKFFVAGQAGYAYNKESTDRYNVGGLGVTATGDTHSDEWTARADLGRNYPMDGGLTLTPDVSANYGYLNTQGYSETGAGTADLNVNSNDQNLLALGIGGTATWKIKDDENVFKPSIHAGYAYNAIDDKVQETSSFAGDPGVSFITEGASPGRNVFDVGAKLVYETKANWDVSATYDFQAKESYTSHTGEVRATAHF